MSNSNPGFSTPEAVEAAFYAAFCSCDLKAMNMVWGRTEVICIHPGSTALVGRNVVLRSWRNILMDAEPPHLHIEVISRIVCDKLAVHVVEEHIMPVAGAPGTTSVVLATNIYRHEEDGWRMLEHHASLPRTSQRLHTLQ